MTTHRFMKYPDNTMKKVFVLADDPEHVYRISVPQENWCERVRKSCSKWVKTMNDNNFTPFRWGTLEKIKHCDFHTMPRLVCNDCKKTFTSKCGFSRHKKICKELEIHKFQMVSQEDIPTPSVIRTFGKENPKWLTSDLLYGVLNNIQQAIPVMMKTKHFNDKFPENKNIRIDTRRSIDSRLQVFEEGRWMIKGSRHTFYKVLISICDILSDALEEEDMPEDGEDSDSDSEDRHIGREIRRLRNSDRFIKKINRIRPLWNKFREKIQNPEQRTDLWEDLKTLLLDRQLAIEQGYP